MEGTSSRGEDGKKSRFAGQGLKGLSGREGKPAKEYGSMVENDVTPVVSITCIGSIVFGQCHVSNFCNT